MSFNRHTFIEFYVKAVLTGRLFAFDLNYCETSGDTMVKDHSAGADYQKKKFQYNYNNSKTSAFPISVKFYINGWNDKFISLPQVTGLKLTLSCFPAALQLLWTTSWSKEKDRYV